MCLLLVSAISLFASGQSEQTHAPKPAEVNASGTSSLSYEDKVTYYLGSKTSAIAADFKSASDGAVFVEMASVEGPVRGLHVYALRPSGKVVLFNEPAVPTLRHFGIPASFFVTGGSTYVLRQAEAVDPASPLSTGTPVYVVIEYDDNGAVSNTVRLDPEIHPLAIAAFGSGDLLVISEDKPNKQTRLLKFDRDGRSLGELRLFDEDYGAKLNLHSHDKDQASTEEYLAHMLGSAQMLPAGDNVLLVPVGTTLPLIEISEHGLVRSTHLSLPKGKTLSSVLPSDDGRLYLTLGHSDNDAYAVSDEARAKGEKTTNWTDWYIYNCNPGDGSLAGRIAFRKELIPLRKTAGSFLFLTMRPEDGRFQVVQGTPVR